ncbi:outer membrane beta-barrel protein [Dyella jejuensis]|uniref:Outer membrane beta-barrel protein n=1 Tax=Dyella jejuensis TaxID=1432009 RepID=A0ABW8JJE1_9GAMM
MRKFATVAVALVLGSASAAAFADGNAFVNADAGASNYQISNPFTGYDNKFSKHDTAGALRVGYRWKSVVDYGVEVGYGFLGKASARGFDDGVGGERQTVKTRGWLLGGNLNYNITEQWYVSGRAGWFRAHSGYTDTFNASSPAFASASHELRAHSTDTGEYLGFGVGYNINQAFSVGLAYDDYHIPANAFYKSTRIGMYTVQGEYRF